MAEPALINDPTALLVFFAGFVALIFVLAQTRPFDRLFRYLPPIVWIYLLPVVLTTAGITPAESPFYDWCTDYLMPCSLLLLVLATDVPAIRRLGPLAAAMLLSGSVGIVIGGPIALAIFQPFLDDPQIWKGLGALSGSWIGGLSNMIAIKEGVGAPDDVFSPMIIVDSVVGYGWMSIIILLSGYQNRIDRWNRARREELDALNQRLQQVQAENARPITLPAFASMLGVGLVASWLCMRGGELLPQVGSVLSHFTWGILLVVAVGLALSFTPVRRLEHRGATPVAYGGLYLMVATMGAGGDLAAIAEAPLVLAVGVVWIGIHVACLFLAMRLLRAPIFLFATGSMGNVGGVISTPVVAGVFQPALAAVGVLMGVLGNLVGTPLGLLCAQLMAWVARAYHGAASL
ncbi:MAG: DUF819 family protein [Acidobacteria bacterium]|nr:DUF819 family protein [Acidobacteriota bacterium]